MFWRGRPFGRCRPLPSFRNGRQRIGIAFSCYSCLDIVCFFSLAPSRHYFWIFCSVKLGPRVIPFFRSIISHCTTVLRRSDSCVYISVLLFTLFWHLQCYLRMQYQRYEGYSRLFLLSGEMENFHKSYAYTWTSSLSLRTPCHCQSKRWQSLWQRKSPQKPFFRHW